MGSLENTFKKKGIDLHYHSTEPSFIEAVVAMGGREVADLIEAAWKLGAKFDAWTEQFSYTYWEQAAEKTGIDMKGIANTPRNIEEPLPFEHISAGVSKTFLKKEYERAQEGVTTKDCTFDSCTACGVCTSLDTQIEIAGERRENG